MRSTHTSASPTRVLLMMVLRMPPTSHGSVMMSFSSSSTPMISPAALAVPSVIRAHVVEEGIFYLGWTLLSVLARVACVIIHIVGIFELV